MRLSGHVVGMERIVYRVLVGKPEGNVLLGSPGRTWHNIKIYHREIGFTLDGSSVTMAWRVLRLRMEETSSRNAGQLRIYWISSRGQPTRGGSPAWVLGVGLTTTVKNKLVTKIRKKPRAWTDSLDKRPKRKKMDMRLGTWNYET
jgi:hypothetical protein